MTLNDNPRFQSLKLDIYNSFFALEKDMKSFLENKNRQLLDLMKIDNTVEVVDLEYLKIQKALLSDSKDKSFQKQLNKYECCIEKKKFNKEFGTQKKAYKELIRDLLLCLRK